MDVTVNVLIDCFRLLPGNKKNWYVIVLNMDDGYISVEYSINRIIIFDRLVVFNRIMR